MLSRKQKDLALPWAVCAVVGGIIWLLLFYNFVPYQVEGESMEPALSSQDRVLVQKHVDIQRGDIIVVGNKNEVLMKRVIGLPGETLDFSQMKIRITNDESPTGFIWDDPVESVEWSFSPLTITLGPDEWYILGDKRGQSLDSRHFGPVHTSDIIGRVFMRYMPFDKPLNPR